MIQLFSKVFSGFIVLFLISLESSAQNSFVVRNIVPSFVQAGDTFTVYAQGLDTSNPNYVLRLGARELPIIAITGTSITTTCSQFGNTQYILLCDTAEHRTAYGSHPLFFNYRDTSESARFRPMSSFLHTDYIEYWNASSTNYVDELDFNDDGRMDILIYHQNRLKLLINQTSKSWDIEFDTLDLGRYSYLLNTELNGSTFPEIITRDYLNDENVVYSIGLQAGIYSIIDSFRVENALGERVADLNADGKPDIYTGSVYHNGDYGLQYWLNRSTDSLQFDTMSFLNLDTIVTTVYPIGFSDSGYCIIVGRGLDTVTRAMEIREDSSGLSYVNIVQQFTPYFNSTMYTADVNRDGIKELFVYNANAVDDVSCLRLDDTSFFDMGESARNFESDIKAIQTANDSTTYRVGRGINNLSLGVTYQEANHKNYIDYSVQDTIHNDLRGSIFGDFNGDGYIDLLSVQKFRVYPSRIKNLNKQPYLDTINFLFDSIGHTIYDPTPFLINTGIENIAIDSIHINTEIAVLAQDSTPLAFPIIINPGDTLFYTLKFTTQTIQDSIQNLQVFASGIELIGAIIRTEYNANRPFSILHISPNTFKPFDTLTIVLANYRGVLDSTTVFFGNGLAEITSLYNDTLIVIAPRYFNHARIEVLDQKHNLSALSTKHYSMVHVEHNGLHLNESHFPDLSDYHSKSSFDVDFIDYLGNDIYIRESTSSLYRFYRSFPGEIGFDFVGTGTQSSDIFTPLNGDNKLDLLHLSNFKGYALMNNAAITDSFPFSFDTASTIQNTPLNVIIEDLDGDGYKDLLQAEYGNSKVFLNVRTRRYDKEEYHFEKSYRIPIGDYRNFMLSDLDKDGAKEIVLITDSFIHVYKNNSRPGQFIFNKWKSIQHVTSGSYTVQCLEFGENEEILLVEYVALNDLRLHTLSYDGNALQYDSVGHLPNYYALRRIELADLDGNGRLDILAGSSIYINKTDSNGIKFHTPFSYSSYYGGLFMDMDADGYIDIITDNYVYLNKTYNVDVISSLESMQHLASYPYIKDDINEPSLIYSTDTSSFSISDTIRVFNTGMVPITLTALSKNANLLISDTLNGSSLQLPIVIDTTESVLLYIRNNNALLDQSFIDTLRFEFDFGFNVQTQEVIHTIRKVPVIDSISPQIAMAGDTIYVYGKNLLNPQSQVNQLRLAHQKITPLTYSNAVYSLVVPERTLRGEITITDTINRLYAVSGQEFIPKRQGPGGAVSMNYFKLGVSWTSNSLVGNAHSNKPNFQLRMVDLNDDGTLDLFGQTRWYSGTIQYNYAVLNFDENQNKGIYDFSNSFFVGSGRSGTSTFPKAFSTHISDVNNDGKLDAFSIDFGDLCSGGTILCDGLSVNTPQPDSNYNATLSPYYQQTYQYTGRYDGRSGAPELIHDFNRDGLTDVIWRTDSFYHISSISDYYTKQLIGTNNETVVVKYSDDQLNRPGGVSGSWIMADIDGDGRADVLDGGGILLNQSNLDSFSFNLVYNLVDTFNFCSGTSTAYSSLTLQLAYLNDDDKPDLIGYGLSLCGASGTKAWFINESTPGNVSFIGGLFHVYGAAYPFVTAGDLNGDGKDELIGLMSPYTTGNRDSLYIYTNLTDSAFDFSVSQIYIENPNDALVQDFDGDGSEDLLISTYENQQHHYYLYKNVPFYAELSTALVEFSIPEDDQDSTTVWFKNTGAFSIDIDSIEFTSINPYLNLQIVNGLGAQSLAAGDSIALKLIYTGDSIGTINDSIRILHNAYGSLHTIVIKATTLAWPKASISVDSIYFSSVRVGNKSSMPIKLYNDGNDTLHLSTFTFSHTDFSIQSTPPSYILAGDSVAINVLFAPSQRMVYTASLSISHNALSSPNTIGILAEGIAPELENAMYRNLGSYSFGNQNIDSFYFKNTGTDVLQILSVETGTNLKFLSIDSTVAAGDSGLIIYELLVSNLGVYNDSIQLLHDEYDDSTSMIYTQFTGLRGDLFAPAFVEFEPIAVDSASTVYLMLINTGTAELSIDSTSIASNSWFSVEDTLTFPMLLGATDTIYVPLHYSPTEVGAMIDEVKMYTNAFSPIHTTFIQASSSYYFEPQKVLQVNTVNFTLFNRLSDTINTNNVNTSNQTIFRLNYISNRQVLPLDTIQGKLRFSPQEEGFADETGFINWGNNLVDLKFTGFGISPRIVPVVTVNLPPILAWNTAIDSVYIKNTGSDTLFVSSLLSSNFINVQNTVSHVLAGDSAKIRFQYSSASRNNYTEWIKVVHDYHKFDTTLIRLIYYSQSAEAFTPTVKLNFREKSVGTTHLDSFYIRNNGNINLVIDSFNLEGDVVFALNSQLPMSIAPSAVRYIVCSFSPNDRDSFNASLSLYHNALPNSTQVLIEGIGIGNWIDSLMYTDTLISPVNTSLAYTYRLYNQGEDFLRIDSIVSSNAEISILNSPVSIAAHDSGNLYLRYLPNSNVFANDTILVYHNHYRFNVSTIIVPNKGKDGVGQFIPQHLEFGSLNLGTKDTMSFVFKNIGDNNLKLFFIQRQNAQFTLLNNPKNITLLPNDSIQLRLSYTPSFLQEDIDTLFFWTDSKSWPTNYITAHGQLQAGQLKINDPVNLGRVKLNTPIAEKVIIENIGNATIQLDSVYSLSSGLNIALPTDRSLDSGEIDELRFNYTNTIAQDSTTLYFVVMHSVYSSPDTGIIELKPIWPELNTVNIFSFNDTKIHHIAVDSFWIFNTGSDTLYINGLNLLKVEDFELISALTHTVLPHDSIHLIMRFSPVELGLHTDSLWIMSNAFENDSTLVHINGLGIQTGAIDGAYNNLKLALYQNYPNPGDIETTVSFKLPEGYDCTLNLYNEFGQHINTLFTGKGLAGINTVSFNTSALASGTYYYQLEVNGLSLRKNMVIMH